MYINQKIQKINLILSTCENEFYFSLSCREQNHLLEIIRECSVLTPFKWVLT